MQTRSFNRPNPRFQWVPKSALASSSSSSAAAPRPSPVAAPPPPAAKAKGKNRRRGRGRRKSAHRGSGERRNWADLPSDALSIIFQKISSIGVLFSAQGVCQQWWRLAHEKETWKKVDFMSCIWDYYDMDVCIVKMALTAISRSQGQLEEFSIEHVGNDDILLYLAEQSPGLKCLRLVSCYAVSNKALEEAVMQFPALEEMNITIHSLTPELLIPIIGKSCPILKSFHLNTSVCNIQDLEIDQDLEALAIAKSMPLLRELQLICNLLTNNGLLAILDGCPHLESLDLRRCLNIVMNESLEKKCAKIKNLRLPYDSTADYLYDVGSNDREGLFWAHALNDDYDEYMEHDYESDDYDDFFEDFNSCSFADLFINCDDNTGVFIPELMQFHAMFSSNNGLGFDGSVFP